MVSAAAMYTKLYIEPGFWITGRCGALIWNNQVLFRIREEFQVYKDEKTSHSITSTCARQ